MEKKVECCLHKGGGSGKGGDESTARRSVGLHDEKQGTQNGALKNTTVGGIQG